MGIVVMVDIDEYVSKHRLVSRDECPGIIEQLEHGADWQPHEWYSHMEDAEHELNDFSVTAHTDICDRFQSVIEDELLVYAHTKMGKFPQHFFNTNMRFNKYAVGEGIREHVDHIHSIFDSHPAGIPVLSMVGCFNDDYEGGVFHLCDKPIDIEAGEFIIFPSLFIYPHYVTPVTKGHRYSWVSWAC